MSLEGSPQGRSVRPQPSAAPAADGPRSSAAPAGPPAAPETAPQHGLSRDNAPARAPPPWQPDAAATAARGGVRPSSSGPAHSRRGRRLRPGHVELLGLTAASGSGRDAGLLGPRWERGRAGRGAGTGPRPSRAAPRRRPGGGRTAQSSRLPG